MNQPILRLLATTNYKNLYLGPEAYLNQLNILIGSNGSGKSNFISCLKFLKDCLIATPDENRGVSSFEDAISKLGHDRVLDVNIESPAKVSLSYCFSHFSQTNNPRSVILDFKLYADKQKARVSISEEYLYSGENLRLASLWEPFYYYKLHETELGKGVLSVYDTPSQDTTHFEPLDKISTNSLGLLMIPQLLEDSQFPPENTPVYKIRRELIEFISKWQFYNANNMNLNLIRTVEPKIGGSDIYLSASGDNLPLVLENLSQNIDFEDSLNEAMKSILPKTRRIRPVRSGRLSLTVEWYFEDIKEAFYLNEMSDGTVRMLCWATILHSPLLPSLIVIDEPELGLHVSWMPILAEWIKKAATRTQIIITTHSPDLLDHFTDRLENVLCFYSENKTHFSVKSLSKEMLEPKLEEGWQLGDLYRVGDPSIGGWPW
ncbi:AAA family ATPase [Microcoleus sp.]|uniref:AAA family ATPase n=1 Tax=Microcoleus sp. TaxID=44472 RepID=UPI003523A4EA